MKPLTAIREYHYWSERLVSKIYQDNVVRLPSKVQITAGVSNLSIQAQRQDPPDTRAARAESIEKLLADHIVTDLDYRGPLAYLHRNSPVVLSSLRMPNGQDTGAVTLFADLRSSEGKRIAVCLFGSAQNVCGYDPDPPRWRRFGWTSSSSDGVELILHAAANAESANNPEWYWQEAAREAQANTREITWNAQNICAGQGMYHSNDERSWHRGYTIGHYKNAEWLAQIYFTDNDSGTDDDQLPLEPYDVVYVGAALWVRSSAPRTWVPYTTKTVPRLDADQHRVILRPFARIWYRLRGQHLIHTRHQDSANAPYE